MKVENFNVIMEEKRKRRNQISELQTHAQGMCTHIGKISPGCRQCFTGETGGGVQMGMECMCNCPMCYYDPNRKNESPRKIDSMIADMFYNSLNPTYKPVSISYQSAGETMMYLDWLEQVAIILQNINRQRGITIYHHLYTNGILANKENLERCKRMGVHELRFHVSASNFSKQVYKNMYEAAKMGFTVTVEEPSWPLHREKLFEMLAILNDVGGRHLDLVEVQLTPHNVNNVRNYYPEGKMYKHFFYHLYDGGLVYDIIEEVLAKGYGYSVIDCNSEVECCRQGKHYSVGFEMDSIEGMCDEFDYFSYRNPEEFYIENQKRTDSMYKGKLG